MKALDIVKYVNPKLFLSYNINNVVADLDREREELRRVSLELLSIVNSPSFMFDDCSRVRGLLVELYSHLDTIVSMLMEFEELMVREKVEEIYMVKYARGLLRYIKEVIASFPSSKVLVAEQDTVGDSRREMFMVEMYRTAIYHITYSAMFLVSALSRRVKSEFLDLMLPLLKSKEEKKGKKEERRESS